MLPQFQLIQQEEDVEKVVDYDCFIKIYKYFQNININTNLVNIISIHLNSKFYCVNHLNKNPPFNGLIIFVLTLIVYVFS